MLNLVLFGPPGAGKGTQSEKLISKYQLVHVSTGDLFRAHVKGETELGKKVSQLLADGELVPDAIILITALHGSTVPRIMYYLHAHYAVPARASTCESPNVYRGNSTCLSLNDMIMSDQYPPTACAGRVLFGMDGGSMWSHDQDLGNYRLA